MNRLFRCFHRPENRAVLFLCAASSWKQWLEVHDTADMVFSLRLLSPVLVPLPLRKLTRILKASHHRPTDSHWPSGFPASATALGSRARRHSTDCCAGQPLSSTVRYARLAWIRMYCEQQCSDSRQWSRICAAGPAPPVDTGSSAERGGTVPTRMLSERRRNLHTAQLVRASRAEY